MPESSRPKPCILLILDGFGIAPDSEGNAITRANMPVFRDIVRRYPAMTLRASGEEVGLSWGEMGNSEVGHLAIGAGRVYYQTFPRINRDIAAGGFYENPAFLQAAEHAKKNKSTLHLIGMVSAGRVHSMDEHCHALLEMAKRQGMKDVAVHAILDGRDTIYNAGIDFLTTLSAKIKEIGVGRIASLSGRYFAMDRDNRWDRIQKAYEAMALGRGEQSENALAAVKASYTKEIYDEEFVPTVIVNPKTIASGGVSSKDGTSSRSGEPVGQVKDGDAIIFFNFRPDRMREIVKAFVLPDFKGFARRPLQNVFSVTMAEYEAGLPVTIAFPPEVVDMCLAEVISKAGLKQLHIAETEKYAHVTFFLNGTQEQPFPGEERIIVPSPKVASYDAAPAMSAEEVTDRVVKEIQANAYDFIAMNLANPDMVAHTGNLEASIKADESVDVCIGRIVKATLEQGGAVFLTADHGNAEELRNLRTKDIDKEHSTNPVPFLLISKPFEGKPSIAGEVPNGDLSLMPPIGMLADVAPTILAVMGLPQPPQMGGQALI